MELRRACAFVFLGLFGCKTPSSSSKETAVKSAISVQPPENDLGSGHCLLFGRRLLFFNCSARTESGEALHAVLQASLLSPGSDLSQLILNDQRITGEENYTIHFRFQSGPSRRFLLKRSGLPEVITGELRRGLKDSGGKIFLKEVTMKTHRELFGEVLGREAMTQNGAPYFAFLDEDDLWAASVGPKASELTHPLRLRILDPLSQGELETLKKGAVILFKDTIDHGNTEVFRFYNGVEAKAGKPASIFPLTAEIIH